MNELTEKQSERCFREFKRGTTCKDNRKRRIAITVRVSPSEKKRLEHNAEVTRLTLSELIRQMACNVWVTAIPPGAYRDVKAELTDAITELKARLRNGESVSEEVFRIENAIRLFQSATDRFYAKDGDRAYLNYRTGDLWEVPHGDDEDVAD